MIIGAGIKDLWKESSLSQHGEDSGGWNGKRTPHLQRARRETKVEGINFGEARS